MALTATNWRGQQTDPAALMDRYGVVNHPAGPGPAMRLTHVSERFGRAAIYVTVPTGHFVRMVIPGEDKAHPTDNGMFTISLDAGDHTYYPLRGDHGPFGFAVAGVASDYVDGNGLAYGQYDDDPSKLPDGQTYPNNYGHLDLVFAWDTGVSAPTTPTEPTIPAGGIVLTPDEAFSLRASLANIDSIVATATNRRPA